MKAGRPVNHIKAKWITLKSPDGKRVDFFELDEKGKILKKKDELVTPTITYFNAPLFVPIIHVVVQDKTDMKKETEIPEILSLLNTKEEASDIASFCNLGMF